MRQHQDSGLHQRSRVRQALADDVGCGPMHGFEHGAFLAEICRRHDPKAAHQARREVRHDIAIQVRQHQQVERLRSHYQLHAAVVHDQLGVLDLWKLRGGLAAALQEQAVAHLHDVGLVDSGDFLAPLAAGVFKSRARDACGCRSGDDLQAFHNAGNQLVLDSGVEVFRVFTKDDHVDRQVLKAALESWQHLDRPEIHVHVQLLAQRHIHTLVPAADRSGSRPLQSHARALDRLHHGVGQHHPGLCQGCGSCVRRLPFDRRARSLHRAHGRRRNFRADAVAGDQGDLVSHYRYYTGGGCCDSRLELRAEANGRHAIAPPRDHR